MSLLKKIFCLHEWESHDKGIKEKKYFVKNQYGKYEEIAGFKIEFIREVLICKKCGKIKKIEY